MSAEDQKIKLTAQLVEATKKAHQSRIFEFDTEIKPETLHTLSLNFGLIRHILAAIETNDFDKATVLITNFAANPRMITSLENMARKTGVSNTAKTVVPGGVHPSEEITAYGNTETPTLILNGATLKAPPRETIDPTEEKRRRAEFFAVFSVATLKLTNKILYANLVTDRLTPEAARQATVTLQVGSQKAITQFFRPTDGIYDSPFKINNLGIYDDTTHLAITITLFMPSAENSENSQRSLSFSASLNELQNGVNLLAAE